MGFEEQLRLVAQLWEGVCCAGNNSSPGRESTGHQETLGTDVRPDGCVLRGWGGPPCLCFHSTPSGVAPTQVP